jgi:hypothetical protein
LALLNTATRNAKQKEADKKGGRELTGSQKLV